MTLDEHVAIAALAEAPRPFHEWLLLRPPRCRSSRDRHDSFDARRAIHRALLSGPRSPEFLPHEPRATPPSCRPARQSRQMDLDPVPAATAARTISTCARPLLPTLPASSAARRGCGSIAITAPLPPTRCATDEREIAPVGADVYDDHAGGEKALSNLRLLRLVPSSEARFARDGVAQIADKAPAAEICRQIG